MKYFLIAGEPSGDMHAADLMAELRSKDKNAEFAFLGGDLMKQQGGQLLKHYQEMAFMGIIPVIKNLGKIKKNFTECERALIDFDADVLILIDYPGFNLRMARFAKENNISTCYYISPKVWAWKTGRVKKIKAYVDKLHTIFPFETGFFKQFNYPVQYVGNPVYDKVKKYKTQNNFAKFCKVNYLPNKPVIALLPGSRTDEISRLLPVMAKVQKDFPDHQLVISGAPNQPLSFYHDILNLKIPILFDQTYEILCHSVCAVVASGTATLETALFKVPQVVVYKMGMGWFLETFRKQILKTDFFSLVNLVAEKEVVKELFQSEVTMESISAEIRRILNDINYRNSIIENYEEISISLKSEGAASEAAKSIVKFVIESKS